MLCLRRLPVVKEMVALATLVCFLMFGLYRMVVVEVVGGAPSVGQRLVQNADDLFLHHVLCSASTIALDQLVPATHPLWRWIHVCYDGTIA